MNITTNYRLTNRSIENLNIKKLLNNNTAKIFYSDPPWSSGNLKYLDFLWKKFFI